MDQQLSQEVFAQRADDVLGLIARVRGESNLHEAINAVIERYVDDEPHPELKRFGEILSLARRQATLQERLDDDREALHHGHLNHEQLVSTGHHYETLRYDACLYNHMLRGFIESCGQYFSREDILGWLTTASQGRGHWAQSELTGAISEVALHAALQGLPELRGLRYASLEEDLHGYDYIATWQGKMLTVDAKTGFYRPLTEIKHGHRHLEISVPREVVKDFRVTRHGLDLLRREVRQALYRDAGADVHPSHHHYQSAQA